MCAIVFHLVPFFFSLVSQSLFSYLRMTSVEVHTIEDRKKEKSSKLLSGLKSKRDKIHQQSQSQSQGGHSEVVDTIRIQMQASCNCMPFINARCNTY